MGMIDQRTPDGSLKYNIIGYMTDPSTGRQIPRYEAVTALSADAQALRDANNRGQLTLANLGADQASRAGELLSRPMDTSSLPQRADRSNQQVATYGQDLTAPQYSTDIPSSAGLKTGYESDFSADRQRVEDALMARLNPQLEKDRARLETSLSNRGIKLGSAAYDRGMDENARTANDARYGAILNAGQEQSRLAGLTRDEATFGNSALQQELLNRTNATQYGNTMKSQGFADQQAIQGRADANTNNRWNQQQALLAALDNQRSGALQETMALRQAPINEITALLSGSQISTPQFQMAQPAQMATTDVAGITQQGYANQMAAYQQKMAQQQAMMGGLFGLGSAALLGPVGGALGGMMGGGTGPR